MLVAGALAAMGQGNTTVFFDDLPTSVNSFPSYGPNGPMPVNYDGLVWNGWSVENGSESTNSGYYNAVVTSPNVAFNSAGGTATITATNGSIFTVASAYFTAAWNDNLQMQAVGYGTNGTILYNNTYTLNTSSKQQISLNYSGISSLVLTASGGTLHSGYTHPSSTIFAMDNLVYSLGTGNPPTPTPISGTGSIPNAGANPPANRPGSMVAEPVDTATGAHVLQRRLLGATGAQPLDFIVDYDSICLLNGPLGTGWSHNFEANIQPTNSNLLLHWNAKRSNLFVPNPSNTNQFACPDIAVVYDLLTRNTNGTYTLKLPGQQLYQFDATGRLNQIVNPHAQVIQLTYATTNAYPSQIQEVISGKSLYLTYNSGLNLLTNVSDNLGRNVTFVYNASNYLSQVIKTSGATTQTDTFNCDSAGRILSEINPDRVQIFTDTFDSQGRVATQADAIPGHAPTQFFYNQTATNQLITTVVDRIGATNIYVHDNRYLLWSITDPLGHVTNYGYDTNGNQTSITNALGWVQSFAYDGSGNMIAATDAIGQQTSGRFDTRNNLIAVTNAAGSVATFTYDGSNNPVAFVDFLANQVTLAYDTNALLAQTISSRGGKTSFVFNGGLATRVTDAATNTTQIAYDAVGRPLAVTNAAGFVTTNAYDLNDNLIAAADGLGNVWRFTYDSFGRKLSQTDPLNNPTRFFYDGNGNLTNRTDALGNTTSYFYDGDDRLVEVLDANSHTTALAYDVAGRLISIADALNHTNSFQYDAVGNLLATVDALGVTNQITTYDPRNLPITTQNALGQQSKISYDNLQRFTQLADALNRTNQLAYDADGQLIAGIDPLSLVSRQHFDGDGNSTNLINPRNAQMAFQYDLASRLTSTTTAAGRLTSYKFDGRNFVTNIVLPSGAMTTLTNDAAGRLVKLTDQVGTDVYGYDNKGRLLTVTENSKSITNQYDALDRLTNYTDAAGNNIKYAYDSVGNLTNLIYPDGKNVAYAYDAANRLTNVTDWGGRKTTYTYDANGRVTSITLPNGTVSTRSYDIAGRLVVQRDATATTNLIYQVNYNYDAAGQIIGETNQPAAAAYLPVTASLKYDADNALTNYAGQVVTNDANGNLIYGPLTNNTFASYSYDARNRLTGAGGIAYTYDPLGNRVALTNNSITTEFVVNPNTALSQVLMRIRSGVTNYYVYGAGLLYEVTPTGGTNKILTYHHDYRGSTVAITDTNGAVTDQINYSPYGNITSRNGTNDTPFLFNGLYGIMTDPNGLLNMRARFYNTTICRFLNPDPSGFKGGDNFYCYANGDPISLIDPFGLSSQDSTVGAPCTLESLIPVWGSGRSCH